MLSTKGRNRGIPPFTVLLLMAVMAVIGIAILPTLDIRYTPEEQKNSITVSFEWPNTSERIVEAEVTSKIEGILSGIRNCTEITSSSSKGKGSVQLKFKKGTDMSAVRFEVASRIRNAYSSLPEKVSYPYISLGIRGTESENDLTFVFNSPLPSLEIEKYISDHIILPISSLDGVETVSLSGTTPYEIEILFDANLCDELGITINEIEECVSLYSRTDIPGLAHNEDGIVVVKLHGGRYDDFESLPVKNVDGRIIFLRDVATATYKEAEPQSYYRLNGLNTITLNIATSPGSNIITVADLVRDKMDELEAGFPPEIGVSLSYDSSEYIAKELEKIIFRTILCVIILLLLVFVVYRSFRYLALIFTILMVNLLVAVVIYKITGLSIHIYTLAGITVSLGIIIDSSIVMTDHYSYYRNKSVFPALLGATATTIGALCVVLLLPEQDKKNLADFSKVIIINLTVSLVTAYYFIPSLIDRFPLKRLSATTKVGRRKRFTVRFNSLYSKYIALGQRRRWIAMVVFIAAFGIPIFLLPEKVAQKVPEDERNFWQNSYNKVMAWRPYYNNRTKIDKVVGSSFALFNKALARGNIYRETTRPTLEIRAGMPEGCTVSQLNEVIKSMENYLSNFDEIDYFSTSITSYSNARIVVSFKPEYEFADFPSMLKSNVIRMASDFGGANWRVFGIDDQGFSNYVYTGMKYFNIKLSGYNYDDLVRYSDTLILSLSENRRISDIDLLSTNNSTLAGNEFNFSYDFTAIASRGVNPYRYFSSLESRLYDKTIGLVLYNGTSVPIVLRSSDADDFDLWTIRNTALQVDSAKVKLSEVGQIEKKRSGLSIMRKNQSYEMKVGFNFVGSNELAKKVIKEKIRVMNEEVLPVGYKAVTEESQWSIHGEKYGFLVLLVVAIIYVMCSMIFEALRMPLAVILMIPISFIGVFLTFGWSEFIFDQGGFAAFVMLCGIVVNAGIYIANEYLTRRRARKARGGRMEGTEIQDYVRSYNHKIIPIMLTVVSTLLGLIPFLFDGPKEVFWFAFAIGTISGLIFSLIALILFLPLFSFKVKKRK